MRGYLESFSSREHQAGASAQVRKCASGPMTRCVHLTGRCAGGLVCFGSGPSAPVFFFFFCVCVCFLSCFCFCWGDWWLGLLRLRPPDFSLGQSVLLQLGLFGADGSRGHGTSVASDAHLRALAQLCCSLEIAWCCTLRRQRWFAIS